MDPETDAPVVSIPEVQIKPNWRKDIKPILILFCLYILQGVPLGLIVTIPFLLQSRGVSYQEIAKFSLAFWPFSLKVLYAPIIDAVYIQRFGRRKSWLIPLQYMIAFFMFVLAFQVDDLLATGSVTALTAMFFSLNFLAASQDVVVDGWALTMLSPENVGYASSCNAVGMVLGSVMGYSGFLILDSSNFANNFRTVPLETGLVSFPQFLFFWAIVFALTTTLIMIFKTEAKESAEVSDAHMDVFGSYKNLWKILKLRNIQILALFLLTLRIGMAATDGIAKLKFVESGVLKETIAFYSILLIPFKLLLPLLTAKWTTGTSPMKLYINTVPFSLAFGIIYPIIVFWSPGFKSADTGTYGMGYYAFLFVIISLELIPMYTRFVAGMAFAAKVSDPAIGGTYMTLINTISNVGGTWPSTLALWVVNYVEIPLNNGCETEILTQSIISTTDNFYHHNNTIDVHQENATMSSMYDPTSKCVSKIDGYYVLSGFCVIFGFLWLIWGRPTILRLQKRPKSSWRVL